MDETLVPRWVPYMFAVLSLALVPGIARVFASAAPLHLVTHWRLAWGGFDVALAALLAALFAWVAVRFAGAVAEARPYVRA